MVVSVDLFMHSRIVCRVDSFNAIEVTLKDMDKIHQ